MILPVTNLILMNEMDLKSLMLLCLQFHFVIVMMLLLCSFLTLLKKTGIFIFKPGNLQEEGG